MDPFLETFSIGDDTRLDGQLFKYELAASQAHARMLHHIGILSEQEYQSLNKEMRHYYQKYGDSIPLEPGEEDIHSKLEALLISALGDTGKKLHTGRSRNDQVLVVTRLFAKEQLLRLAGQLLAYLEEWLSFISREGQKPLPGYTHTKQAMLVTAGFWADAWIESGLDTLRQLRLTWDLLDQNPLGSGSGFGVPLALDREMTSRELGFSRVQFNAMYAQNSRGRMEALCIDSCWAVMHDLSRVAADLLMYNMDELLFVETDSTVTTGSSIMPQKRNLDIMELIRARSHRVLGHSQAVRGMLTGLISGYNRDLQETKQALFDSFALTCDSLQAARIVISRIRIDEDAVNHSLTPGIFATDIAFQAVAEGMPFRDAYRKAAQDIQSIPVNPETIRSSLSQRNSPGAPLTLDFNRHRSVLDSCTQEWQARKASMQQVMHHLLG